ncbi:MAG: hypothetical protein E4G94_01260 [ANME-2 cluster archaeon]|nr:MAG: hypothetical protein E4G94_01260 [ANME-2 cluster archaeon]
MIHRRILILMFIAAALCVMGVGIGAAGGESEMMDLMQGNSGAIKALGRQSNGAVYLEDCCDNHGGAKLW